MIEILSVKNIEDLTLEELTELRQKGVLPESETGQGVRKKLGPYGRTRAQVMATGNKWAMENFNATHS